MFVIAMFRNVQSWLKRHFILLLVYFMFSIIFIVYSDSDSAGGEGTSLMVVVQGDVR
jgi:hypothetical protein